MGRYIIKLEDYYLLWSTIVDAPITLGMSLNEFKIYYRVEYGEKGMENLSARLIRVNKKGCSGFDTTLDRLLDINRAGPDESKLTRLEIIDAYCHQLPIRNDWVAWIEENEEEIS